MNLNYHTAGNFCVAKLLCENISLKIFCWLALPHNSFMANEFYGSPHIRFVTRKGTRFNIGKIWNMNM